MARIRSIKPEFPQSESMGRVSRDARLCFIQLWTLADDAGRMRGRTSLLASLLFPYDEDAGGLMEGWLLELEREQCIRRYDIGGDCYLAITNWKKHQRIDKPTASKIRPPDESGQTLSLFPGNFAPEQGENDDLSDDSETPREDSCEDMEWDLRKGSKEGKGKGSGREAPRARRSPVVETVPPAALVAAGFDEQTATEFIAHKARLKAPLTPRAWQLHLTEAEKAGWTPQLAAERVMAKGWKGFEAAYVVNGSAGGLNGTRGPPIGRQAALEAHNAQVATAWAAKQAKNRGQPE